MDVLWDDLESFFGWDCAVDVPTVGLEPWGYFDIAQSAFEGGNMFVVLGNVLSLCQDTPLTFAHVLGILLSSAVDGGDEAIGRGSDGLVDVILFAEDILGGFGG